MGEEAALHTLVEQFFAAYAKKDLDGVMGLWSDTSPQRASHARQLTEFFALHDSVEVKAVTIRRLRAEGQKASLRVALEMNAVESKSGQTAAGLGKMLWMFECTKEQGKWKVWRQTSAAEYLADALLTIKSDQERAALRREEQELVTDELVQVLIKHADGLRSQREYPQALSAYGLAQQIAEEITDEAGLGRALIGIGVTYYSQGEHGKAVPYLEKSLALAEKMRDDATAARALNVLGAIRDFQTDYQQALEYYQKSLQFAAKLSDRSITARTLHNIGLVHARQGNYPQALDSYHKALRLAGELGDKPVAARTMNEIGLVHRFQGEYQQSLEYYQKSLRLGQELKDDGAIAYTLNNIGLIHNIQGNVHEALDSFHESLQLGQKLRDKSVIARALNELGNVYHSQGNYQLALEHYEKSLRLAEELDDTLMIVRLLNNIGLVHRSQGSHQQALEYFQKSLERGAKAGDKPMMARALQNIGVSYLLQRDYTEAIEYLQKSRRLAEELGDNQVVPSTLRSMALAYSRQGNYERAVKYFEESLQFNETQDDKGGIATALNGIGEVHYSQGNYTAAVTLAERAAALARETGLAELFWEARTTAGKAHRALNEMDQAREAFAEAIATIETLRSQVAGGEQEQQRFFEEKLAPYHEMVDLLVALKKAGEAFTYAERAKGRVLWDVLHGGRIDITKAMTAPEQEREQRLRSELVSLNSQLAREKLRSQPDQTRVGDLEARVAKARLSYEAFQTSLYGAHPGLKVRRGEILPVTLSEAARLLPDAKSAVLEFVVTEKKTYLFVVTQIAGGDQATVDAKVYPVEIQRRDLVTRTQGFRDQLARRDLSFRVFARQLYELLVKPARKQLDGKNTLIIVPDGVLWELPFQALLADDRYLLEDYALAYAPSLSVLREMVRSRSKPTVTTPAAPTLLAIGNPALTKETVERAKLVYRDGRLDPLPEAEREVTTLGRLYGTTKSKVYVGAAAREEQLKIEGGRYEILHLATHGIFNDASPMYSHLVLSQAENSTTEDGLLEAWELLHLDLKADLVVLSACETARGRVGAGEGVIGLTWAVFVAGSPSTVVSQWKVESASTTQLMVAFHRRLKSGSAHAPFTKAQALRQAALMLLKSDQYRHPYYWAGFVLVGDGFSRRDPPRASS